MPNGEQVLGDKPEWLVRGHPVQVIKASEVYWTGKGSQRALATQVEIVFEVAHGQFPKAAIDGLAVLASAVVRFGHGTPVTMVFEYGDYVIGVVLGFKIDDQRGITIDAQSRCSKQRALKAVGGIFLKYAAGRPGRVGQVIRLTVKKALDAVWMIEAAQFSQLTRSEPGIGIVHSIAKNATPSRDCALKLVSSTWVLQSRVASLP